MHMPPVRVAQKENGERRIDQQDILYRVVFFLAAITVFLFSSVLGTADAPFRAVVGKRGAAGATVAAGVLVGAPVGAPAYTSS